MAIKLAKGNEKKIILKAFGNSKISRNDLNKAVDVIRSLGIEEKCQKTGSKICRKG